MPVWAKAICVLLLALVFVLTSSVTAASALAAEADASGSDSNTGEDGFEITGDNCYAEGYEVSVDIGAEGSVLLKNDGILPLAQGTRVTVLGAMSYNYVEGGTGSAGGADDENTTMMNSALIEAGLDVNTEAWNWLEQTCGGSRGVASTDPAGVGWTSYSRIHEFPIATYDNASGTILQNGYTDYAIVTIARSGAEGASIALPVFAGFMKQVYEDPSCGVRRTDRFYRPAGAIEYDCPDSEAPDRMQDDEFFE